MSAAVFAAEYTKGPKSGPKAWLTLNVIENGSRRFIEQVGVSGKAEARKIAKTCNATCWNF